VVLIWKTLWVFKRPPRPRGHPSRGGGLIEAAGEYPSRGGGIVKKTAAKKDAEE